jgi:hypothetical protein
MANIFVRSPYIVSVNETGQVKTRIDIFLWNGTGSMPTTPAYTLSKLIPSSTNTNTSYDISPYVREYLSHSAPQSPTVGTFTSLATSSYCNVYIDVWYYDSSGVDHYVEAINAFAFDGYTYYEDGYNYNYSNENYLLEQKEYFYDEDTSYAGEVAMYLTAGQKISYKNKNYLELTGVVVNSVFAFGSFYTITTLTKTGNYTSKILPGEPLTFTYANTVSTTTSWSGTVLTCTYNSGTNITTITPDFEGFPPVITGTPTNTNRIIYYIDKEVYTVPSTKWYSIPRIYGSLNILSVLDSSYTELATWTFTSVCEPKYTPVTIDFINKYGAWQREFFFKASKTNISIESSDYNVMQTSSGYDTLQGQKRTFNANARETISVNSGYVNEDFSSNIKQLIMSERILVDNKPAICKTKSLELMKNINNHMINYSLEFEFAYNTINSVI